MIPLVGFLPADDPRMRRDGRARSRSGCMRDGFVARYDTAADVDGLPAGEGAFLAVHVLAGRQPGAPGPSRRGRAALRAAARTSATTSACSPRNTTPIGKRQLGNFPQAFSHVCLVNTARNLAKVSGGPSEQRHKEDGSENAS